MEPPHIEDGHGCSHGLGPWSWGGMVGAALPLGGLQARKQRSRDLDTARGPTCFQASGLHPTPEPP